MASGISEQAWFSEGYLYLRWNLKAYGGIILQLEANKMT
jgi:hypothetical protein